MPLDQEQAIAMLREHVAAVVTATQEFEEARQRVAASGTALSSLLDDSKSPLFGVKMPLSFDADDDIERRARSIAADVLGEGGIELSDVPRLVGEALELRDLVEFFLARSAETAVA